MRYDAGTTDVPNAGTRVQLSTLSEGVLYIFVQARAGNTGSVFFGVSDVSSTNGIELAAGGTYTATFNEGSRGGSIPFKTFYVDAATNGNDLDWAVTLS